MLALGLMFRVVPYFNSSDWKGWDSNGADFGDLLQGKFKFRPLE